MISKSASAHVSMQLMRDVAVTPPRRTRKSDETRSRILEAALELFRERGFEATTMRDIARASEIALGATYYHFASKEAIVLAFYELAKEEMSEPLDKAAKDAKNLQQGLRAVLDIKFAYFAPNRKFLGALFPHAADPQDPLSPFSEENHPIRLADQQCFQQLLASTKTAVPADLAPLLPDVLWLYQMALILIWICDRSAGQRRTQSILAKSLPVVVKFIQVSRLSLANPVRSMVVELLEAVLR
jgi:AcrR family transcriptional regulator